MTTTTSTAAAPRTGDRAIHPDVRAAIAGAVATLAALGRVRADRGDPAGRDVARRGRRPGRHRPPAARRKGRRRRAVRHQRQARPRGVRRRRRDGASAPLLGILSRRRYALAAARLRGVRGARVPGRARRSPGEPRDGRGLGGGLGRGRPCGSSAGCSGRATVTTRRRRRRRCRTGRAARSCSGPARSASAPSSAGVAGRQLLERQRVAPAGAGAAIPPAAETVAGPRRRRRPVRRPWPT